MIEELKKQNPNAVIQQVPSIPPGPNGGPVVGLGQVPVNIPTLGLNTPEYKVKGFGKTGESILRYPYEALTESTDYLQIDIRKYNSVAASTGGSIVSGGSIRSRGSRGSRGSVREGGNNFTRNLPERVPTTTLSNKKLVNAGTILLPIPSNVQDGNSVSYASGNLDGVTAGVFDAIKNGIAPTVQTNQGNNLLQTITTAAMNTAGNLAGNFTGPSGGVVKDAILSSLMAQAANIPLGGSLTRDAVFARTSGSIINQNVELLFNGVTLRSFKFSFKFTPRGPKEAQQVKFIINTFKQNMAPKLGGGSGDSTAEFGTTKAKVSSNNLFLKTPSVFELTYKQGNGIHPFLHSFKQCVLTDMSVNYTGEGTYATYAGRDGTPVSMVLELGFKELEPIYDKDYNDPGLLGVGY